MARLFYVDESYDDAHHFVVGVLGDGRAIATAEQTLEDVSQEALRLGYPGRRRPELHGSQMLPGVGDWAAIQLRDRIRLVGMALDSLTACQLEVLCRGVEIRRFQLRYGENANPHPWAFRNLLERLNERLEVIDNFAVVIADEHSQKETLRADLRNAQRIGTPGYRGQILERIRDTAHFVDSERSRMIQLADIVAYVRRRRARGVEDDPRAEQAMQVLYEKIARAVPEPSGQFDTIWCAQ